jgi:hypothetical protein
MTFGGDIVARAYSMHNRRSVLQSVPKNYSDEFYTPAAIVAALGHFDLDPCCGPKSYALRNIRLPESGLTAVWKGRVWLNPPYLHIHEWIAKFKAHGDGVALFNARPDTRWFQSLAEDADGLLWLRGRLEFERPSGASGKGPVGSVLIAYGGQNFASLLNSGLPGIVMTVAKQTGNLKLETGN